jgi:hypothetical protein
VELIVHITISVSISYIQLSKMSDNAGIKAVSRHLPLLRMPLLLNNLINLILSGLLSFNPIFQAQLALISISTLASAFDLIQYWIRRRWARKGRANVDQDVQVAGFTATVDGGLSVGLLAIWITGLVAFGSWDPLIRAVTTFGAFIAWYAPVCLTPLGTAKLSTDIGLGHFISPASVSRRTSG